MAKVAVITGGGGGIGRAVGIALARDGWRVVLAGRHQATLDEACAEHPQHLRGIVTDVSDESSVRALFAATTNLFGRIDLLFNNAGTGFAPMPVTELTLADWSAVMAVNVTGAFLCARGAFRRMAVQSPRGGRIINNGSISAYTPRPNSLPYTVSKHAITGLTRALALEGRAYDIACGQIDIGNAATTLTRNFAAGTLQADGRLAPEPVMDVQHVASSVLLMADMPLDANVQFMTVMATKMPFIGRG